MKNKKSAILFLFIVLAMVVCLVPKSITAVSYQDNSTTLILEDGHSIDVADVREDTVLDQEEYIKTHLNNEYVQDSQIFEPADVIYVKHLIADENYFNGDVMTIDSLNYDHMDALLVMNTCGIVMWDIDENSDYYVAYVDSLHDDDMYYVADSDFAYTNLNGELIEDAIYDKETGIAYVPKKYKEEDKNV